MQTYGEQVPEITYRPRPGAYAVIIRDGLIGVVEVHDYLYLPGGGIEPGEDVQQTLLREIREETGWRVQLGAVLGEATDYYTAADPTKSLVKHGHFYRAMYAGIEQAPTEADHHPAWVTIADLRSRAMLESAWRMAEQALTNQS